MMNKGLSLRSLLGSTALPRNEAHILMAHVLDKHYQLPRSAILSRDEMELDALAIEKWYSLESKRLSGEPVAYLIGKRDFHNIELTVAPGVLIPRPETELLVDIALQEIKRVENLEGCLRILDLGTGSGAIALAIAHELPHVQVIATDQSSSALEIAKANAKKLGLDSRVKFLQGDWYHALDSVDFFDVILSNPPYIAGQDPHLAQGDLRYEPISALTDHADGLSCLQAIIRGASSHLNPKGLIAVEHGFDQSEAVAQIAKSAEFTDIHIHQDLAGHNRVISARK